MVIQSQLWIASRSALVSRLSLLLVHQAASRHCRQRRSRNKESETRVRDELNLLIPDSDAQPFDALCRCLTLNCHRS